MPKVSLLMLASYSRQLTQICGEAIDISGAVGSGSTGVGPVVKDKATSADWAPWGLSLAGNGLMAEAAAAGTLKLFSETSILDQLSSISSVSGGSWFNAQFAYSRKYFQGVVDKGTPIEDWYTGYEQEAMGAMAKTKPKVGAWEEMIGGMYVGYDKGLKDMPANTKSRAGNAQADLLICTTLNGQSVLSDNSTIVQFSSAGGDAFFSNPAFWLIPADNTEGWNVPGVDLKSAKWTAGDQTSGELAKVLPSPTVTKVSAMSSAANGASSNPALLAASNKLKPIQNPDLKTQNPLNGVCTTPGLTCEFPSMMAMDGCYSDNLGFALNVGYLQKKFPGKNLRLMGVSSELCDRATDPTCAAGVNISAFRGLFADAPFSSVEGYFPDLIAGPNRAIFKESITDAQALGQQTGYGGMSFMTGTFTTVQNDHFGVAAGTKVMILILNVNGPTYLQPAGPGVPTGGFEGLATVARNAYHSAKDLFTAYDRNNKVSSDDAFLYYQSVLNAPTLVTVV